MPPAVCPFAQLAVKGREHFGLAVSCRGNMVGGSEGPNGVGAGVLVIEPDQITAVEIVHSTSWSRSSLIVRVESVPPRRCLRWARNARVNLGLAKKGLAGVRSARRLPDPPPGVFVKFADGDRFHVSHCVALEDQNKAAKT